MDILQWVIAHMGITAHCGQGRKRERQRKEVDNTLEITKGR